MQFFTGEFVVVLGASGSGKSTLLNLIGGMDSVSAGEINFATVDITKLSEKTLARYRKEVVGFIFQFYNLMPNLSAIENVEISELSYGMKSIDALKLVGLEDKQYNFPSEMSGGEQQRVALARALVNKPEILLCDEPTGNLDPKTSWDIMKLLEQINEEGTTVVVVTHNHEIVDAMQKRVITMRNGLIISDEQKGGYLYGKF